MPKSNGYPTTVREKAARWDTAARNRGKRLSHDQRLDRLRNTSERVKEQDTRRLKLMLQQARLFLSVDNVDGIRVVCTEILATLHKMTVTDELVRGRRLGSADA